MPRVVARRALWSIPLLFGVSISTFVLVSLTPGDPARTILGQNGTQAEYEALRQQLGLNQPLWEQYWRWLSHVLRGDLGTSLFTGQPVTMLLDGRLTVSLTLIVGATLLSTVAGVLIGVASALRGGFAGRSVDVVAKLGLAIPTFILGLVLVLAFAVRLQAFPATGFVPFRDSPGEWLRSLVLPVVTLSVAGVTIVAQQTRDAVLDALNLDFVRVLQANGFSRRSIVYRHVLRSAAIPIVSLIGVVFVSLLSGTVFVETIFALPGLGSDAVQATEQHDIPLIQGVALYFALIVIVVNLLVDLLYTWLNPRVRAEL